MLTNAVFLIGSGVLMGLVAALAAARFLTSFLFNLSPRDPITFGGMALLRTSVALLASYLLARQATRVDPLLALKND